MILNALTISLKVWAIPCGCFFLRVPTGDTSQTRIICKHLTIGYLRKWLQNTMVPFYNPNF